jgi:hypothetical protein
MYEAIKEQFDSKKVIAKKHYYQNMNKIMSELYSDMYPMCMSYYHELNPAFLMQIPNMDLMNTYKALTVRDGLASFGTYVLKNFQRFPTLRTHLIISPALAPLLPPDSTNSFSCFKVVQKNPIEIQKARKIILTGIASLDTTDSFASMKQQLDRLKMARPDCEVEIFFPQRRNPLNTAWKDSYIAYEIIAYVREILPVNKISFLTLAQMLGQTTYQGYYCLDLMSNDLVVSDNYLNHFIAARGGTVSAFHKTEDENTGFELDLSFFHKLQIVPLPKCESLFPELVFYKKQSGTKDYMTDPKFHRIILKR